MDIPDLTLNLTQRDLRRENQKSIYCMRSLWTDPLAVIPSAFLNENLLANTFGE